MNQNLAFGIAVPSVPLERARKRKIVMRVAWIVAIPCTLGLISANPLLTVCGFLLLPMMVQILWQPHEPPVLLFAAFFQWMQAFTPVMAADVNGLAVGQEINLPDEMALACYLSLAAIASLVAGMRRGHGSLAAFHYIPAYASARLVNSRRMFGLFFISFIVNQFIAGGMWLIPGLTQFFIPLYKLHAAVVVLLFLLAVHETRFRGLAYGAGLIQIVYGFMGFFSNYKEVFFYAIIAVFSKPANVARIQWTKAAMFVLPLLLLGFTWQAVKSDYRAFLNRGERSQVVVVPITDRFAYLYNAISDLNVEHLLAGSDSLVSRLGYVEYFAYSITRVPDRIPHEHGRLWGEVFERMLTPRIFYPDKAIVDDSARTTTYTGIRVAGAEEGTSIGLGYVAESYIDFGPFFMFIPIYLVGWMWGRVFRYLVRRSRYRLLDTAVAINFLIPAAIQFEASNIKFVGGAVSGLIILTIVMRYLSNPLWKYLTSAGR